MAISALVPLVVFVLVAGGVGVRLVGLWRKTGQIPEMALGFGLALVSLGMPFAAAGRVPGIAMEPLGRSLFAAGLTVNVSGICMMIFFTYWVFRAGSRWGLGLFAGLCSIQGLAVAFMCAMNFTGSSVAEIKATMRPGTFALMGTMVVAFVWGALEAFHYLRALRRQLALGLGDPVIANRFLLWGIACATSAVLVAVVLWCVFQGMTILREPLPLTLMAVCGSLMSASWYLTFFAPERYQRFIRGRAAQNS